MKAIQLFLLAIAICAAGQADGRNTQSPATTQANASLAAGTISPAQARNQELERRNQILEAKGELEDKAFARFELFMGGLGVVITLLVVGFGIFTHRAAVMAARQELADLTDKVQALHDDAAAAKERALEAAELARSAAEGAQAHERTAQEEFEKVREAARIAERVKMVSSKGNVALLSEDDLQTVSDAAKKVEDKLESTWSSDEFRVKILQAYTDEDWDEVLRLARGMEFLHGNDRPSLAFALFYQAAALGRGRRPVEALAGYEDLVTKMAEAEEASIRNLVASALFNQGVCLNALERNDDALAKYRELISQFGEADDSTFDAHIVSSMYNIGVMLGELDRFKDEITAYDDVVARFSSSSEPQICETVAMSLVNKAVALEVLLEIEDAIAIYEDVFERYAEHEHMALQVQVAMALTYRAVDLARLGRFEEAIEGFDRVLDRFEQDKNTAIRSQLERAKYMKARSFARLGRIKACIDALEKWRLEAGEFDCEAISVESDFEGIRSSPTFVRYLRRQGCLG